jgi:hypothetical protein
VGLEQRFLAAGDPFPGQRDQRAHVGVQLVHRAVVGVQCDVDRVPGRDHARELGERDRAGDHVLDALPGQVLGASGGYLEDAIALGVGEAAERGVQRLARGHVDRRIGESVLFGPVEHLRVDVWGRDGHGSRSLSWLCRPSIPEALNPLKRAESPEAR